MAPGSAARVSVAAAAAGAAAMMISDSLPSAFANSRPVGQVGQAQVVQADVQVPQVPLMSISAATSLLAVASLGAASSRLAGRRAVPSSQRVAVACRAQSIAATAVANGNFTVLVAALKKAELVETMSGAGSFTVFAPTDKAFSELLAELGVTSAQLLANPDLKKILLYHVVSGKALSKDLKNGQKVGTLQGSDLSVSVGSGKVSVGRATVATADIECSNGIIHVIDKVLLPPAKFDPSKQVGVTAPFAYFDPAGFSKVGDEEGFRNLQASEIKHGRVAMMAAVGAVAQHFIKFPGFGDVPAGLQAVTTAPGTYGFAALFVLSGALELTAWSQSPAKEPGNFGDPLGLRQYTTDMREREINNGRMAMFATIGIIAAELLTGKDGIQQLGF